MVAVREIYPQLDPVKVSRIEVLAASQYWDVNQLRTILIELAQDGEEYSVPGYKRPESIHLQGWSEKIRELLERTRKTGNEYSQMILVDIQKHLLFFSQKIVEGDEKSTHLDPGKEAGRESVQRAVASIHTHPTEGAVSTAHGFSGQDFLTFLSSKEQQLMLIAFGNDFKMLILKTSATPKLKVEDLKRRIQDAEKDYLKLGSADLRERIVSVVRFNEALCSEFGLVLYVANKQNRDLFERKQVAHRDQE